MVTKTKLVHAVITVHAEDQAPSGAFFNIWRDSDSDSDKTYSTKIYTSTISGLHEFLRNTNNTIVLIYK